MSYLDMLSVAESMSSSNAMVALVNLPLQVAVDQDHNIEEAAARDFPAAN
jgi:hypothetical protein